MARLLSRGVESSGFKSERQWLRSARTRSASVVRQIAAGPASSNRHSSDADSELPKIACEIAASTLTHRSRNYSTSLLATLRSREHGAGSREKNTGWPRVGSTIGRKIRGTTILANWFSIKSGNCNGRKLSLFRYVHLSHFSFKPARVLVIRVRD